MRLGIRIALHSLGISMLVACGIYAHRQVSILWKDIAARQELLQDSEAQTGHTNVLKKRLDAAKLGMNEIQALIPSRTGIVDVVSLISAEAVRSGIAAQVPIVKEANIAPEAAPEKGFSDIRIQVVASGKPSDLASFLYRIEHLPYILHIVSWKIDTTQQTAVTPFTNEVPAGEQAPLLPGSSLTADISLIIKL